jgi:hypothetical protein
MIDPRKRPGSSESWKRLLQYDGILARKPNGMQNMGRRQSSPNFIWHNFGVFI